jgi:tRNA dimethylallyltransferase
MRSLEIIDTLGAVPQQEVATLRYPTQIYLMNPSRETLRKRVTLRLSKRLKEGMIEEVESLLKKGYDKVSMKKFGLEYDIISQYLRKEIAKEQMEEILITKTMQYAKRQQTWNKKYEKIAKKVDII